MKPKDFIALLKTANKRLKSTHKLRPALTAPILAAWRKKNPGVILPADYLALLRLANGFGVNPTPHISPNGVLHLLSLKDVRRADHFMEDGEDNDEYDPHWYVIAEDDNGDWAIILDTATGKLFKARMCSPEPETEFDDFPHFLDYAENEFLADTPPPTKPKATKKATHRKAPPVSLPEVAAFPYGARCKHVAVSPDGKYLAVSLFREDDALITGTLCLYDLPARTKIGTEPWIPSTIPRAIAFSPDSRLLFASYRPSKILVIEATTGVQRGLLDTGDEDEIASSLAFSADGGLLLAAFGDYVKLWEVGTGRKTSLNLLGTLHNEEDCTAAAFALGGKAIVSIGDRTIRLRDLKGEDLCSFAKQKFDLRAMAVSPDGNTLFTGGVEKITRAWDLKTATPIAEFSGYKSWANALTVSPNGKFLLLGSDLGSVIVWEIATGTEIGRFTGHYRESWCGDIPINGVAFLPDSAFAISAGSDHFARQFSLSL